MDGKMLNISYKMKGLGLHEVWFAPIIPVSKKSLFGFYCYRDSRVESKKKGLTEEVKYTLVNDLTIDKEKIFAGFKSNVRNEIRKGKKIPEFTYQADYESRILFLEFYRSFAKAKNLPDIKPYSIEKYGDNLFYLAGYLDNKLTNMQLYLIDKESGIVRLLHSISTLHEESDKTKRAKIGWINRYLHWHAIGYFIDYGFKSLDWGGYSNNPTSGLAGIDKFKASFGGQKIKLYDYYTLPYQFIKMLQSKFLS